MAVTLFDNIKIGFRVCVLKFDTPDVSCCDERNEQRYQHVHDTQESTARALSVWMPLSCDQHYHCIILCHQAASSSNL